MFSHPLFPVFVWILFMCLRRVAHALRDITWLFNGTRRLKLEYRKEENYERSAHVLTIAGRYRYDSVAQSTHLADFILYHDGFTSPEYVLRDEVTLYHVTDRHAVFVECATGDTPWRLDDYSFSRDGQFRKAKKVVILPIQTAHKLAEKMGPPKGKVLFIGNIARCGSTLLSQIFEKTGLYTSYTEPGVISDLINTTDVTNKSHRRHVMTTVTLLCKPELLATGKEVKGHAIKVMATVTCVLPMLHTVFPDADFVFVYRNHLASMKSLSSLLPMLPFATFQRLLDRRLPSLAKRHAILNQFARQDQTAEEFGLDTLTQNSFVITKILAPTFVYNHCLNNGMRIPAFKYESLTRDPEETLAAIFKHCDIPRHFVLKAMKAMEADSQHNSMLSQDNTMKRKVPKYTEEDMQLIRVLCEQHGLANLAEDNNLKGTVFI